MISAMKRPQRSANGSRDALSAGDRAFITSFETELGWTAIAWREDALLGLVFGHGTQRNAELALAHSLQTSRHANRVTTRQNAQVTPQWITELIDGLQRFAEGEPVDFSEVPIAVDHLTSFGRRVVAACRRLSWGQTRSYGDLASECGAPGAARAVGTVMAKNRFPLVVPCHRVLAAGGALGGYSAPDGLRMKRRLLTMEKIVL